MLVSNPEEFKHNSTPQPDRLVNDGQHGFTLAVLLGGDMLYRINKTEQTTNYKTDNYYISTTTNVNSTY